MEVGFRLGQRLEQAFTHAGYLVGLRDGIFATAIAAIVLYLITERLRDKMTNAGRDLLAIAAGGLCLYLSYAPRPSGASPAAPHDAAPAIVQPAPDRPVRFPHRNPRPRTTVEAKTDFVTSKTAVCPFDDKIQVTCDLPSALRLRNTGGMGRRGPGSGAGLCVPTSFELSGRYSNESRLFGLQKWMTDKPGGADPDKLDRILAQFAPGVEYVQHTAGDVEFLKLALKTGRMPACTYCGVDGLPDHYGNQVIAHFVDLVFLDANYAAILDNNFPGEILWMSAENFIARWKGIKPDGSPFLARNQFGRLVSIGGGWAALPLNPAPPPPPRN